MKQKRVLCVSENGLRRVVVTTCFLDLDYWILSLDKIK